MAKKVFFFSLGLFILASLSFGVFSFINKKSATKTEALDIPNNNQPPTKAEEKKGNGKMQEFIKGVVLGATINDANQVIYYKDQKILITDLDGKTTNSIGSYPFKNISQFDWATDKKSAIVQAEGSFFQYLLDTDKVIPLKAGADFIKWGNEKKALVYKYFDKKTNKRSLNVADVDGTNWQELGKLNVRFVDFQFQPQSDWLFFYPAPDSLVTSSFSGINIETKEQKMLLEGKYGADYLWSNDGKKVLVSFVDQKSGKEMHLAVMNQQGGEFKDLNFPTLVKKCVWSKDSQSVYCAMLSNVPNDAIMPNDWNNGKIISADYFWKIDTNNGKKTRIIEINDILTSLDGEKLFIDKDERFLFFKDRKNGSLFRINL